MHITLAPELIFHLFGLPISNTIITTWVIVLVLLTLAVVLRRQLKAIPSRLQNMMELVYLYFLDTAETIIGRRDVARDIFPFVMTLFLFIALSNWSGLLPGNHTLGITESIDGESHIASFLRAPSTDLNLVLVMAMFAVAYVQYMGIKYLGFKKYLGKFFNFSNPINMFIGLLELLSEFIRIVSYTFRLFGNIFAGSVLVTVIYYLMLKLVPYVPILPLPFYILEAFVGGIQAFVFCFLVIVLTSLAIADHGEHGPAHDASHTDPDVVQ